MLRGNTDKVGGMEREELLRDQCKARGEAAGGCRGRDSGKLLSRGVRHWTICGEVIRGRDLSGNMAGKGGERKIVKAVPDCAAELQFRREARKAFRLADGSLRFPS